MMHVSNTTRTIALPHLSLDLHLTLLQVVSLSVIHARLSASAKVDNKRHAR